jgi:glucan-binding YG repeat protein
MKFDMKKRILALALAGTTAFSVFGAATSAYADSTHTNSGDGAYYNHYIAAGSINWNTKDTEATTADITKKSYSTVQYESGDIVSANTTYEIATDLSGEGDKVKAVVSDIASSEYYYKNLAAFLAANYPTYVGIKTGDTVEGGNGATWNVYKTKEGKYYVYPSTYEFAEGTDNYELVSGKTVYANKADGSIEGLAVTETALEEAYDGFYFIGSTSKTNLYPNTANTVKVTDTAASNTSYIKTDANYSALSGTSVSDLDAILSTTVANGYVYLYDYYYDESYPSSITASAFATAWNTDEETLAKLLDNASDDKDGTGTIFAEDGTGVSTRSIRANVITEFKYFLDDLGIKDVSTNAKTLWADDLLDNYNYTYYGSNVISGATLTDNGWVVTYGKYVDVYNFSELVEDILDMSDKDAYEAAQTSELIYLMQQYDRMVGDLVSVNDADTDDWGDLLVSLIEAPTSSDFRSEQAYNRYKTAANTLVKAYNEATTTAMINSAELAMYDFVTAYNSAYTVGTAASKTDLAAAIDSTYFNANWAAIGESYAGLDTDGVLGTTYRSDSQYSYAWALYPVGDYAGSVSGANPGVSTKVSYVTSDYYWFYNVYDLAYNVYNSNKYQSTIDVMTSALTSAIDALAATPDYSSRVLRAEEQNAKLANLVETDYKASMWANRNKISNYIDEKVSADEIGSYGTNNAAVIASETATLLGYQRNQTVVSTSDIKSVKTAKTAAEAALKELQKDDEKYTVAQAKALEAAIDTCDYIIKLYDGTYSTKYTLQSVNGKQNTLVADKDQLLKSMIDAAVEEVNAAIDYQSVIQGWNQTANGWTYGTEDGYVQSGWKQINSVWYYFENGVALQSTWKQIDGKWYYLNSNCGAAYGWAKVDGSWYYFGGDNAMKTGWVKVDGSWYYLNAGGKMVTGWAEVNGTWYYFSKESNALGQMLANTTTPDGYTVDANGALVD